MIIQFTENASNCSKIDSFSFKNFSKIFSRIKFVRKINDWWNCRSIWSETCSSYDVEHETVREIGDWEWKVFKGKHIFVEKNLINMNKHQFMKMKMKPGKDGKQQQEEGKFVCELNSWLCLIWLNFTWNFQSITKWDEKKLPLNRISIKMNNFLKKWRRKIKFETEKSLFWCCN